MVVDDDAGSSPLARGLPVSQAWHQHHARIIPARAGFTLGRQRQWFDPGGSSPLARGLLLVVSRMVQQTGIIPARAGFTTWSSTPGGSSGDHPRSRGVYVSPCPRWAGRTGSSPLARGLRVAVEHHLRVVRIIPARAGFTTGSFGAPVLRDGSSPLARGLRYDLAKRLPKGRIIPARAGFTCHAEGRVHQ